MSDLALEGAILAFSGELVSDWMLSWFAIGFFLGVWYFLRAR